MERGPLKKLTVSYLKFLERAYNAGHPAGENNSESRDYRPYVKVRPSVFLVTCDPICAVPICVLFCFVLFRFVSSTNFISEISRSKKNPARYYDITTLSTILLH